MKEVDLVDAISAKLEKHIERYKSDIDWLDYRKSFWEKDKIRIGVVGVTSSGKSTLINAILGSKLLSDAVRPSSSQLVSCSYEASPKMTVYFQNGKSMVFEGKKLTPEIVRFFSDENYNNNNKENVQQIELSTPNFSFNKDILLIDSPGLDAYNLEMHEKLTLETLIPTIDICIFVTTFKSNSDLKMKTFLNIIAKYDCPLLIVQNMYDALRPSLDGIKSIEDVASEHKRRVQRIIEESDIRDKNICQIVQMSAIEALKSRNSKLRHTDTQYNQFVETVNLLISGQKPRIQNQRIKSIVDKFWRLIEQEENTINDGKTSTTQKFVYENLESSINEKYNNTITHINNLITILDGDRIIAHLKKDFKINSVFVDEVNAIVKSIEKEISDVILSFNDHIYKIIDTLNISRRDLISFNGLPNIPVIVTKTKYVTVQKRVEKKGFGNDVARFFGKILKNNWGYTYESVPNQVIDEVETEISIIEGINRAHNQYLKTINKWSEGAQGTIANIETAIILEKESYIEKKKYQSNLNLISKIISEVKEILKNVKIDYIDFNEESFNSGIPLIRNAVTKEVSKTVYEINKLAKLIISGINKTTIESIMDLKSSKNCNKLLIAWDQNMCDEFYERYFKVTNITCEVIVNTKSHSIKIPKGKQKRVIFIMYNAIQPGTAKNQVVLSGLINQLNENDLLIFVVQDFNELINANGVTEGLKDMMMLRQELDIKNELLFMINHENPLLNMVYVDSQFYPCKTISEETEIIKYVRSRFAMFTNPKVEKILNDIIRIR